MTKPNSPFFLKKPLLALGFVLLLPISLSAQVSKDTSNTALSLSSSTDIIPALVVPDPSIPEDPSDPSFLATKRDSLKYATTKARAEKAKGLRIVIQIYDRSLYVLDGHDTVFTAPVAVASGRTLSYGSRSWTFKVPRGVHRINSKQSDPVWTPPLWHYAEVAREYNLKIAHLDKDHPVRLANGSVLSIRGDTVGLKTGDGPWLPMLESEEIVFDGVLYIAPPNTIHGHLPGELGPYALYLGDGYILHGTPDQASIGQAATHGCFRLRDEDITWLYDNIPEGTRVYIY